MAASPAVQPPGGFEQHATLVVHVDRGIPHLLPSRPGVWEHAPYLHSLRGAAAGELVRPCGLVNLREQPSSLVGLAPRFVSVRPLGLVIAPVVWPNLVDSHRYSLDGVRTATHVASWNDVYPEPHMTRIPVHHKTPTCEHGFS